MAIQGAAGLGYARGVAYRDDADDVCEAPTSEGTLRVELAPRHVRLAVAHRSIEISDAFVTIVDHHRKHAAKDKRSSIRIAGRVIVARDVAREGVGVWAEVDVGGPRAGIRRVFGVEPINLLEPGGLAALAALDRLAQRLQQALAEPTADVRRAFEIGSPAAGGLDKVLVIDHGDRWTVYARRLFRDRARFVMAIHDDGRIVVRDPRGAKLLPRRRGLDRLSLRWNSSILDRFPGVANLSPSLRRGTSRNPLPSGTRPRGQRSIGSSCCYRARTARPCPR